MPPKRHSTEPSLYISFAQASSPQQRPSSKYVDYIRFIDTLANKRTQECDVEITSELRTQFVELHRIMTALRRQDVGPALE